MNLFSKKLLIQICDFMTLFFEYSSVQYLEYFLGNYIRFIQNLCLKIEFSFQFSTQYLEKCVICIHLCLKRHLASMNLTINSGFLELIYTFEKNTKAFGKLELPTCRNEINDIMKIVQ